jgi:hypothetical protein
LEFEAETRECESRTEQLSLENAVGLVAGADVGDIAEVEPVVGGETVMGAAVTALLTVVQPAVPGWLAQ